MIGRPSLIEKETPFEKAKLDFEVANRAYNAKKVRTRAEYNYVMSLRAKYAVEYKRMMMPPSEYDRPYTGNLTIERVADPDDVHGQWSIPALHHDL